MTRSGGDFQPRPLKRLFTMSRYKIDHAERNHRVVGKAERLTWHKAWTAVSSGFNFLYVNTICNSVYSEPATIVFYTT